MENPTTIFLADVLVIKVFFYSKGNACLKRFCTSKYDINDTILIYGTEKENHHNCTL